MRRAFTSDFTGYLFFEAARLMFSQAESKL
jgi:hypothetical protein